MKLMSMTDFVLQQDITDIKQRDSIVKYANFLKQPLKLEMFVPCDEDGDILDEPMDYEQRLPNMMTEYDDEVYRYKQAKEKVLFEGFEVQYGYLTYKDYDIYSVRGLEHYTIESSLLGNYILKTEEIQLTENAVKQIGL